MALLTFEVSRAILLFLLFRQFYVAGCTARIVVSPVIVAALVHGYASLIANNAMKYDPDAIRKGLIMIAEGLERKEGQ